MVSPSGKKYTFRLFLYSKVMAKFSLTRFALESLGSWGSFLTLTTQGRLAIALRSQTHASPHTELRSIATGYACLPTLGGTFQLSQAGCERARSGVRGER